MSNRAFQRHGPDSSLPGLQSLPVPDKRNQDGSSPTGSSSDLVHLSHDGSRQASPFEQLPHPDSFAANRKSGKGKEIDEDDESDFDPWDDDIEGAAGVEDPNMPSDHRVGRSSQNLPLLAGDKQGDYEERDASSHTRHSRFREQDSDQIAKQATKKRYTYAACFLAVSLVSFAVQTETAVYIQHNLGWKKPYCMLYDFLFDGKEETLADTFSLGTSHTAHGQSYGQHNSLSFASKNSSNPGHSSGAAMFPSSARRRK
jgi:hypothetical protein